MKKFLLILAILACVVILVIATVALLTPWMDRWGATNQEVAAALPGDELVLNPAETVTRVVTIQAAPEEIFLWLLQMGADKGGLYSISWLEANLLRCKLVNADRIHPEWLDLKVGDQMKMCPGDFGPPPYEVAQIKPDQALVLGHRSSDGWAETWQFVLQPQSDSSVRLVMRNRSEMSGGIRTVLHPGIFIMQRAMLLGIKDRAEQMSAVGFVQNVND
jgi:hypothetical protein